MPAHALQWRVYDIRICLVPVRAPSRVNPLLQGLCNPCGSGFTREEARKINTASCSNRPCIGNR
ncbi:hypothetical protein SAMN05216185_112115 [Pseudomonas guariconensis]|uniref:Uncharacterized protein n=1 Tax=Pseudomonas putida TaxID=303 RepID=A0A6S5TST5_PSEPU|nr:hypothetical protein WP4W18C03_45970 [Pseudomonas putida]BBT42487.1 hypothetical protein WP8W18C01_48280 [Pseudomonas putida]SDD85742.1 hypothetical protein SAMN05216185_112115 [Pseudomonas guariconensis]